MGSSHLLSLKCWIILLKFLMAIGCQKLVSDAAGWLCSTWSFENVLIKLQASIYCSSSIIYIYLGIRYYVYKILQFKFTYHYFHYKKTTSSKLSLF